MERNSKNPVCLTVAGVDPSGGAGVIADLKTFAAFGCYGAAAITSLTFQNTLGVYGAVNQSAESVRKQIEPVIADLNVDAVKTGMLPTVEVIETVAEIFTSRKPEYLVVDPVVRSTSGFDLIDQKALDALVKDLFPIADIITPNLAEAERIAGFSIENLEDMQRAANIMHDSGAKNVLIKGGHKLKNASSTNAVDRFFSGGKMTEFVSDFIDSSSTHGTGCTLASAIAANLAIGRNLQDSIIIAKRFVTAAIRSAPKLGGGNGPVNHFVNVQELN
ncbi:MAG: bifunctional hydroxymethylpyrimidine kinase/phosphomethylpyrimidine kinase [Pyrinomonadaceae bacterium]|nr:bifunctional hydroxymethylpyrimidine kinase/phosphomethylpyrimidine kinase [Pyrinomonadaceae bacterium]